VSARRSSPRAASAVRATPALAPALLALARLLTKADTGAASPVLQPLPALPDLAGGLMRHRTAPLALTLPVEVD
jgi:hypothetical protein